MYDTATDEETALFTGYGYGVAALAYALTGASRRWTLRWYCVLMDPETGDVVHMLTGHTRSVRAIAFSPDGLRLRVAAETILSIYGILKRVNF